MGNAACIYEKNPETPLSVLQAEIATLNQGEVCEVEIIPRREGQEASAGLEGDTCLKFRRCRKYRNHSKIYTPTRELTMDDLPENIRVQGVLLMIKNLALLTVRLVVSHISLDRPEEMRMGSGKSGAFQTNGTGSLKRIGAAALDLTKCGKVAGVAGKTFFIETAAHVVFDNEEAKNTIVEFFFDDDDNRSNVITAKGIRVVQQNTSSDHCIFVCEVETEEDGESIRKQLSSLDHKKDLVPPATIFSFCVSHPHGVAKRVSFGSILTRQISEISIISHWRNLLKILIFECSKFNIHPKKVSYIFTKLFCKEIKYTQSSIEELFELLESKGIICECSKDELEVINKTNNEINIYCVYKANSAASKIDKFNDKKDYDNYLFNEIFPNVLNDLIKQLPPDIPDVFYDIYLSMGLVESRKTMGKTVSNINLAMTVECQSSYSVPTCPGSSGATVQALTFHKGSPLIYECVHSLGDKKANQSKRGFHFDPMSQYTMIMDSLNTHS